MAIMRQFLGSILLAAIIAMQFSAFNAYGNCNRDEFACKDQKTCIPRWKACEGSLYNVDCPDQSDETPEACEQECIGANRFLCADHSKCLPRRYVCDGHKYNCPDNSDEHSNCLQQDCGQNFKCADGTQCVPGQSVCDGVLDCRDRSDEIDCSEKHNNCKGFRFKCYREEKCIPPWQLCNGHAECSHGSDEDIADRCPIFLCKRQWQMCADGSECIPKTHLCDHYPDCLDASDEKTCTPVKARCDRFSFACKDNTTCLPNRHVCQSGYKHKVDCPDKSDESPEACEKYCKQFLCHDRLKCIPPWYECNGVQNCADNSDEEGCLQRDCGNNFKCHDGSGCVWSPYLICDGYQHCSDGSDEKNCPPAPKASN